MIKVKICGITNLEDALAALFNGADAIGFVFYKNSPRCLEPLKARNISRILPKNILRAGVFVNAPENKVKKIAKLCNLDILQFHGNESCGYCGKFKGYKVVKAFRVGKEIDLAGIKKYKVYGYLFDTFSKNQAGGTGKKFNWNLLKNIDKISGQVFLSGGLNSRNVKSALKKLHPDWVDVSSSVESRPGKKDHKKVRRFIEALK
ncbi:MAG: phosphoribosylanthranilate isomerase [Candidatus Omnitrophica bacterium]|nr:phosphoribosylanthranilate isomerase [Candidatus Omnitrophota bacterium]MDD5662014.1 phosphoribosylanthranilate isomerase [Candidatus Omnitrophota bacterium]